MTAIDRRPLLSSLARKDASRSMPILAPILAAALAPAKAVTTSTEPSSASELRALAAIVGSGGSSIQSTGRSAMVEARTVGLDPSAAVVVGAKRSLTTRAAFEALAKRDDVPGAANVLAMKFLIVGADTKTPQLWLLDGKEYALHYDFATRGLGKALDPATFNAQTYFTDNRKNIAGTIVAHDSFVADSGKKGAYALEFWPTDPVKAAHVAKAFKLLEKGLPFAKGQLAYHPAGDTQENLAKTEAAALKRLKVPMLSTAVLFHGVTFSALNPGVGFGTLRVIDGTDTQPLTARDVVLFKGSLPNDMSHVGGIITETPQTPLSHINLKAQQNKTPNAYVKDASKDPVIAALVGKIVRYEVGINGMQMREATKAEADTWLEAQRPATAQNAPRDLTKKKVTAFKDIGAKDAKAFGAKSANIAEMRKFLPGDMVPDGFGIPFSFYDDFMKKTGLYDDAKKMMADPQFKGDAKTREQMLDAFRRKVRRTDVPAELATQISALQKKFPADQPLRCRSSTNNEDLEGFNGAGLYDSYTHRPDEGDLGSTIKQVWSSLWSFRAFDEREFWRIDHMSAAMGVAVHPNSDDETANGVAITKNIYDPNWPGFYVNAQVGESLVTNPDPSAVPDEMLISAIGPNGEYEVQKIRSSSLTEGGKPVLTREQLQELVSVMEKIQEHFKAVYGRSGDATFAMDLEFKILDSGKLWVKQARPVVS